MLLDKLLDGGQPETGAEAFGAEQRLEYARQYIGRYSWSGITYSNFKLIGNSRRYTDLVLSRSARGLCSMACIALSIRLMITRRNRSGSRLTTQSAADKSR